MIAWLPVDLFPYRAGGVDAFGNAVESYGPPEERLAYAFEPSRIFDAEPIAAGGLNRVVQPARLYTDWACSPRDRIAIDGVVYMANGYVEDWNRGPFGFTPGYRINLVHVDG